MSLLFPSHGTFTNPYILGQKYGPLHSGVSENVVYPIVPNGFADHYPYIIKWLFHWEY